MRSAGRGNRRSKTAALYTSEVLCRQDERSFEDIFMVLRFLSEEPKFRRRRDKSLDIMTIVQVSKDYIGR